MNCKPNDRAMVVRDLSAIFTAHMPRMGAVVTVKTPWFGQAPTRFGFLLPVTFWTLEEPIYCRNCGLPVGDLADEILKPLPPDIDVVNHDLKAARELEKPREFAFPPAT